MVKILIVYFAAVNLAGLLSMGIDKRKAIRKQWRIPEATLLTIALIGGSIGSLAGMKLFHHKTLKPKFALGIPVMLVAQMAIAFWLYGRFWLR